MPKHKMLSFNSDTAKENEIKAACNIIMKQRAKEGEHRKYTVSHFMRDAINEKLMASQKPKKKSPKGAL